MNQFYTAEKNAQMVVALLKAHKIRKVVASPGTTNVCLVGSMQHDKYFQVYSCIDERSAAYMACGIAAETGEPVVLSCTGATASRNYYSALTEAYYRKLPILVITSSKSNYQIGHNLEQVTDRTATANDVVKISVQMPFITDYESEWGCLIAANKAMLELRHRGGGPAHINLETRYNTDFSVEHLPQFRAIYRIGYGEAFPKITAKKTAVVVGSHTKWTRSLTEAVDRFCECYNGIVLCDHTSNYTGQYKIPVNLICSQSGGEAACRKMELAVHIGDVSGSAFPIQPEQVWRVAPDGAVCDTFRKLTHIFEMSEEMFFEGSTAEAGERKNITYYEECAKEHNMVYGAPVRCK